MKGIQVAKILELSDAIIINNDLLVYCTLSMDEDEELYTLDINTESEGLEYQYSIKFWENDDIEIKDNKFLLLDQESNEYITVQILETIKII